MDSGIQRFADIMPLMNIHQVKTRYSNTYVIDEAGALLVIDVAMRCDGNINDQQGPGFID